MTPAERARQIDKQEFEAECRAARERALRYAANKRREEAQLIARWLGDDADIAVIKRGPVQRRPEKTITHDGKTLTVKQWASLLGITRHTIYQRICSGAPIERVLAKGETRGKRALLHTINGQSKTLREWAEHAGIKYDALIARMRKGRPLAEALAMTGGKGNRRQDRRGVVSNLNASLGTGAGGTSEASRNIAFPSEEVSR